MASSSSAVATALRRLATLRSEIFQTLPPPPLNAPGGVRNGTKYLQAPLKGLAMLQYYPPRLSYRGMGELVEDAPKGLIIMDAKEEQRLKTVERKKKMGRGPPKKGQGRRAALKKGKK